MRRLNNQDSSNHDIAETRTEKVTTKHERSDFARLMIKKSIPRENIMKTRIERIEVEYVERRDEK